MDNSIPGSDVGIFQGDVVSGEVDGVIDDTHQEIESRMECPNMAAQ